MTLRKYMSNKQSNKNRATQKVANDINPNPFRSSVFQKLEKSSESLNQARLKEIDDRLDFVTEGILAAYMLDAIIKTTLADTNRKEKGFWAKLRKTT